MQLSNAHAMTLICFNSPAGSRCASLAGLEPLQLNSDFINHYRRMFAPSATSAMSAANKLMMPTAASVAAAVSSRLNQAAAITTEDKGLCATDEEYSYYGITFNILTNVFALGNI